MFLWAWHMVQVQRPGQFFISDFCVNFEQNFRNGRRRDLNQFHQSKNKAPNRLMTHFFAVFRALPASGAELHTHIHRERVCVSPRERVVLPFRATL